MSLSQHNSTLMIPFGSRGEPLAYYFEGEAAESHLRVFLFALARRANDGGHVLFEYVYGPNEDGETRTEVVVLGPGCFPKLVCLQATHALASEEDLRAIQAFVRRGVITFDINGMRNDVEPESIAGE